MISPTQRRKQHDRHCNPVKVVISRALSFKSQTKWDMILSSELKLSERFESVKRTIYGIGFTCVVIMGVDRFLKEVCNRCFRRNSPISKWPLK